MRARVAEDQGSVEAVNRAVYATCAALIWHQGLGVQALALAEGTVTTPSKVCSLLCLMHSMYLCNFVSDVWARKFFLAPSWRAGSEMPLLKIPVLLLNVHSIYANVYPVS